MSSVRRLLCLCLLRDFIRQFAFFTTSVSIISSRAVADMRLHGAQAVIQTARALFSLPSLPRALPLLIDAQPLAVLLNPSV